MKRLLLLLAVVVLSTISVYAQQNSEVIVTLKGGQEVRGTITEEIPGESITIKTADGDVFIYRNSEIAKIHNPNLAAQKIAEKQRIEREKAEKKAEAKEARNALRQELKLGNFKGYRGIIDVGCSFGGNYWLDNYDYVFDENSGFRGTYRITATIINGVNFGPHLYMGVGTGIEYNKCECRIGKYDPRLDGSYYRLDTGHASYSAINIPVFLHVRAAWLKERRVSPFLAINAGYSFAATQHYADRIVNILNEYDNQYDATLETYKVNGSAIYLEPSFGFEFRIKQKSAISASFVAPIYIRKEATCGEHSGFNISLGCKLGFSF